MKNDSTMKSIALLAGVVFLIGGGAVAWSLNLSQGAKDHYETLAGTVPDDDKLRKMLAESQYLVDVSRRELDHLEQSVPNLAYVPTLLRELEVLGRRLDIEVTGVRPIVDRAKRAGKKDSPEKKPPYQEINIEINGRGKFENVMAMMEELKGFPKIVAVQTVSLTPKRQVVKAGEVKAGASPDLDATIRIKAYVFAPIGDSPAVETQVVAS